MSDFFSVFEVCWVFKWECFPNLNDIMEFMDLWSCICRYTLKPDVKDTWKWIGSPNGRFATKEMYQSMVEVNFGRELSDFSWLKIWWKAIPSKVSTFTWKVIRDRIPSKENLFFF